MLDVLATKVGAGVGAAYMTAPRDSLNLLEQIFDRLPVGVVVLDRDYRIQRFNATWAAFAACYFCKAADQALPRKSFFDVVTGTEAVLLPLFQHVLLGETVETGNFMLEVDGIVSYWNVVLAPLVESGAVAGIIVMATDVTRRKQAEDMMREAESAAYVRAYLQLERRVEERTHELERRRQVAESMRDILTVLNANRSMTATLDAIVAQASCLLEADYVAIFQVNADQLLTVQASIGLSAEECEVMVLQVGHSATGQAVLKREPVAISSDTAAFRQVLAEQKAGLPPAKQAIIDRIATRIHTLLSVPLTVKDEIYGAIALYYCAARTFTDEEISLALAFGDQAALAIENAQLRERAEQAAVIQERTRLARDLHDSVTQSLYSLTLFAEAGRRLAAVGNLERVAHYLERLGTTAQQALKEMRLLVHQLRPHALEHEGLVGALQQRLDAVEGRAGVQARLLIDGDLDLPVALEAELYHIAQEVLNNALKHAAATAVTVHLSVTDIVGLRTTNGDTGRQRMIRLEISDNGCGFDPNAVGEHGGLGLVSLHERAAKLGGLVNIQSAPGSGTQVIVDCRL